MERAGTLSRKHLTARRACGAAAWLSLACFVTVGCGDGASGAGGAGAVLISGKVTVGGKDIDNGRLEFIPKPGFVAQVIAVEIKNGVYQVTAKDEALAGPYVVTIRGTSKTGEMKEHDDYLNCFIPVTEQVVAMQYLSNAQTPLSIELESGTTTKDFALPALTDAERQEILDEQEKLRQQEEMQAGS